MRSLWVALLVIMDVATACAHVNDRGMDYRRFKDRYGQSCCDIRDCRPADDFLDTFVNGEAVVRLLIDGIWITVRAPTWSPNNPRMDERTFAVFTQERQRSRRREARTHVRYPSATRHVREVIAGHSAATGIGRFIACRAASVSAFTYWAVEPNLDARVPG